MKLQIVESFELRVLKESFERIRICLKMLSNDQLWYSPSKNIPSIGCLVLHSCGNARQWILSGLGGIVDNRQRELEFRPENEISIDELEITLTQLSSDLIPFLNELTEADLKKKLTIQGFDVDGFSAMIHVIEHFSYHTGQITTLTKLFTNKETNYYADVDLDN